MADVNRLGQRGQTDVGWNLEQYPRRTEGFGARLMTIDGHDLAAIDQAMTAAADRAGGGPRRSSLRRSRARGSPRSRTRTAGTASRSRRRWPNGRSPSSAGCATRCCAARCRRPPSRARSRTSRRLWRQRPTSRAQPDSSSIQGFELDDLHPFPPLHSASLIAPRPTDRDAVEVSAGVVGGRADNRIADNRRVQWHLVVQCVRDHITLKERVCICSCAPAATCAAAGRDRRC